MESQIIDWTECKRGNLDSQDLLSLVINNPDEKGQIPSAGRIAQHVSTLLGAAYETCHNSLIWTLVMLDQHPRVAANLLDELRGRLAGAPPTLDRIIDLPLLDAVVKESMRILPPVPQQFRAAQQDTMLAGMKVPRRTRAMLNAFLTNRDPDLYPEPERFKPERWEHIDPSPYDYLVFSAGPRICPGSWFGTAVLKVAIAAILTRYRVALVPDTRIDYQVKIALSPRAAVPVTLHPQDGRFSAAPIRGAINTLFQRPN